jgi:hypothetical protein
LYDVLDPGVLFDDLLQVQPAGDDLVLLNLEQTDPAHLKWLAIAAATRPVPIQSTPFHHPSLKPREAHQEGGVVSHKAEALSRVDESERLISRSVRCLAHGLQNFDSPEGLVAVRNRVAHLQPLVELGLNLVRPDRNRANTPTAVCLPGPAAPWIEADALEQTPRVLHIRGGEVTNLLADSSADHARGRMAPCFVFLWNRTRRLASFR